MTLAAASVMTWLDLQNCCNDVTITMSHHGLWLFVVNKPLMLPNSAGGATIPN